MPSSRARERTEKVAVGASREQANGANHTTQREGKSEHTRKTGVPDSGVELTRALLSSPLRRSTKRRQSRRGSPLASRPGVVPGVRAEEEEEVVVVGANGRQAATMHARSS